MNSAKFCERTLKKPNQIIKNCKDYQKRQKNPFIMWNNMPCLLRQLWRWDELESETMLVEWDHRHKKMYHDCIPPIKVRNQVMSLPFLYRGNWISVLMFELRNISLLPLTRVLFYLECWNTSTCTMHCMMYYQMLHQI